MHTRSDVNIGIVGCGAIGGLLAAYLSQSDANVTVVDRGEQFYALRDRGLVFQDDADQRRLITNLTVVDSIANCHDMDVIFLAVKSHEIRAIASDLGTVLAPHTALVTLQNGIPWWYFQRCDGPLKDTVIASLDPDGCISKEIDPAHILGCVAYPAAEVAEPGVIRHIEGIRFPVGELDGTESERAKSISELLKGVGLKSPVLEDIRSEIWLKAWGNIAFNPVSALTHATMAEIAIHPASRPYVERLMLEAQAVANAIGISFRVPLLRRLQGAEKVGAHKTSMLQDLLSRRPLEIESILGAVIEIADLVGVSTPNLHGLNALSQLLNDVNMGREITHGQS